MAYGFNLGQIEGLDSSVQTITLTIANAMESNTYTLKYHLNEDDMDSWFDDNETFLLVITPTGSLLAAPAFTESDVGDTYNVTISTSAVEENFKSAVETVLVDNGLISGPETLFEGTITITAEDARGVEIPFDKDVSAYPFEKWTVTINGLEIPYQAGENVFVLEDGNIGYAVFDNDGVYTIGVVNIQDASHLPVPGDYQVKIVAQARGGGGGSSGLPDVSASDNGSVLGVVNGEWGVDDRLKDYPSISNNNGEVLGFGFNRDGDRIAQAIVPTPMNRTSYSSNTFFLPFKSDEDGFPRYVDVELVGAPVTISEPAFILQKVSSSSWRFEYAAKIPALIAGENGTYTLKATKSGSNITYTWVLDT